MTTSATDDIPPLRPFGEIGPLRAQAELHARWRATTGPLGFSFRRVWLLLLDRDDHPIHVVEIDDVPLEPDEQEVDKVLAMCAHLQEADGIGPVAMLLSRPAPATAH